MLLYCKRETLLTACQLVSYAVAGRTTKPILSSIKAVAWNGKLALMATDLEIGIRHELKMRIEIPGEAILPVTRLLSILRASSDDEVVIDTDKDIVRLKTASSEYEMPNEDPNDFPDVPIFPADGYQQIDTQALREMVKLVSFATAKENSDRFALSGVLWDSSDDGLQLVGTDTRRLAVSNFPCTFGTTSQIVPAKTMALLDRILGQSDLPGVQIVFKSNEALFHSSGTTIYTRLVEGRFPPYRNIIPKGSPVKVSVIVAAFQTAVKQAAIMVDDESKKLSFHFEKNLLTLQAQGLTTGRSKVTMPIEYDYPPININLDPQYVLDVLRVLDPAASLSIELTDANKPAVFRAGERYVYLVMPMS